MNANLVLALLSKHPHLMYIELAVVTPISPSVVQKHEVYIKCSNYVYILVLRNS
ncbi:Bgt-51506 [Blumeria graminis f. sp. tritici]|uniref:Bgt-51506 n=1 Tax=Blumeria graminis f. sp. tritici TaxID=62690 RepID=A0A9X9MG86_BLUGR|nr:Bgt-51506 [Blumeria graminis f. sp. tritici]